MYVDVYFMHGVSFFLCLFILVAGLMELNLALALAQIFSSQQQSGFGSAGISWVEWIYNGGDHLFRCPCAADRLVKDFRRRWSRMRLRVHTYNTYLYG